MYVKRIFSFFSKRNGATILMNFGQGRRNQFRMGGGEQIFFVVSHLHFQRIHIVQDFICDFQYPLEYEPILALLLYKDSYIVIFKLFIFWLVK